MFITSKAPHRTIAHLLINFSGFEPPPRKRIFKFEEMWLSDERCAEMMEATWSSHSNIDNDGDILKWVANCGRDLDRLNHNNFGYVRKELEKERALLIKAEIETLASGQNNRVRVLKDEINILLDREAQLWSQRSCILWLKNGDNNTNFFHCQAAQRHRKNHIRGIIDESNTSMVQSKEIASVLVNFYEDLFTTSNPNPQ